SLLSSCGGNITISSAGYVTSPGYPSSYPLSEQCVWLIRAPDPQQKILINFNPHFDLENRESPPAVGCVSRLLEKIKPRVLICSRNLTAPSGVIRTPGFPDKYPNNLECTIIIFAPKMAEIVLEFESFDIEPDPSAPTGAVCRFDYLEIWDGYPTVGPHIGRYCGQHSPGRVISYTGILSLSIHTDNAISKEGFSANYSIRSNECMDPLGMESGEISDEAITASSQYNPSWSPLRSRLNYTKNGWTPSEDSPREWIQVHHNTHTHLFHISLKTSLLPSLESLSLSLFFHTKNNKHNSPCSSMLGMVSGHISDAQISVWPEVERGWLPEQARLLTGRSGWVSPISHSATLSPYLELDLGGMRWVTGVVLQGGKHREKSMFVRRFRLSYSTNGSDWSNVLEEYSGKPKVREGNHDTPEVRSFDQLMTRFVRVYPERGGPDGMGLRLELLGCELEHLCVSFWYQFSGDQAGALHIRQRRKGGVEEEVEEQGGGVETEREERRAEEEVLLWMKSRQETGRWREGRVLFPRADSPYQVIIEGVIDGASSGHISVDNVRIVTTVGPEECKGKPRPFTILPPSLLMDLLGLFRLTHTVSSTTPFHQFPQYTPYEEDTVWRFGRRGGSMLKTLDPILITIIVMSAVGVLLGAVCGVVLYCACSQNPDRNLSALENYNFELVDGIKLKKEKVNAQKSYSEA
uniref:Neuropilin 1b n=1 Tax=Astyanax mexicanus TaxID=7994 RepID=A0A8B9LH13_ASTMX